MHWCAAQELTSTCRRQRLRSIRWKFSVEENELIPSLQKPLEVAKRLQEPNNALKT